MSEVGEIMERREHAEHAAHANDPLISRVSITIALLAVVTAVVASIENVETAGAITQSSRAVLAQDKATDAWNFYQAKSLKKHLYDIAADRGDANAPRYRKTSAENGADQAKLQKDAKAHETERDQALEASEAHEKRHHTLTAAATLLQMSIAIATVAIITRRRWPWITSLALGGVGAAIAVAAFLMG